MKSNQAPGLCPSSAKSGNELLKKINGLQYACCQNRQLLSNLCVESIGKFVPDQLYDLPGAILLLSKDCLPIVGASPICGHLAAWSTTLWG